jgi:hypothetical protein
MVLSMAMEFQETEQTNRAAQRRTLRLEAEPDWVCRFRA